MLSDHEQRALDELERSFATESREPDRARAAPRQPSGRNWSFGRSAVVALGCVSVLLLLAGVPVAALALAAASAVGWLSWRLWACAAGGRTTAPLVRTNRTSHGRWQCGLGESVRDYLRWLGEAE